MPGLGFGFGFGHAALRPSGGGSGGGAYIGPIANNTITPTSLCVTGQAEQSTIHTVRNAGGMRDIQVVFPGWYVTGTYLLETNLPSSYTVDACAVEYPVGSGTWYTVRKGGSATWTVSPGGNDYSDLQALGITIPDGADFRLYYRLTGANLPQFNPSNARALFTDEGCNRNAGSTSTPKNVTDSDSNRRFRVGAVAILGTRTGDSVAILGDSQQAFTSSAYALNTGSFADHNRGDIASVIGSNYAYVNLAVGGEQWATALFEYENRKELALKATIIIDEYGINEYNNKGSTTETWPLARKRRALRMFSGKKIISTTTTPRTTGAWTLADGTDQTLAAYSANLPTYAAGLTFGGLLPAPLDRYTMLQGVANKWLADGTVQRYSVDGIHASDFAAHFYAASQVRTAWLAQLSALAPVTVPDASADFVAVGATYGTGFATAGTFTRNDVLPGAPNFSILLNIRLGASLGAAFVVMTGTGNNNWVRQLQINTNGTVSFQNGTGTATPTVGALNFNATNEIALTLDGTNIYIAINGIYQTSAVVGGNAQTAPNFQIAASASVNVNEVTIWNSPLWTTGNHTPVTYTGTEAGCIARWALATNAVGIIGPGMPS